jgi:hypothetical protein
MSASAAISEAAAEFQKILDHRGLVLNQPIGALAHLGLGRAYVLQGDTVKAKAEREMSSAEGESCEVHSRSLIQW